jgi:NAD(P)-dependent dehydrogenase (short-subunit alcohol dehydrogenase family)
MQPATLEGRVAVLFGSASGIGAATARTLAARGAAVVLADIARDGLDRTAHDIASAGGRVVTTVCDVVHEHQVAAAVQLAESRFGRLDITHNNAAAMSLVGQESDVVAADARHWDATMATNLRGQMFGCKHSIPAMLRSGGGSVINTSSATALAGELTCTAYGVSKAGVAQLTRSVATQFGRKGIRCNAVLPGLVRVERQAQGSTLSAGLQDALARHHLTPYIGRPQDIANAVAFLAGDDARFITGHLLSVDGGLNAHQSPYVDMLPFVESTADALLEGPVQPVTS